MSLLPYLHNTTTLLHHNDSKFQPELLITPRDVSCKSTSMPNSVEDQKDKVETRCKPMISTCSETTAVLLVQPESIIKKPTAENFSI